MQGWASVLVKRTFCSLRSFLFFYKERFVLCVLFLLLYNLFIDFKDIKYNRYNKYNKYNIDETLPFGLGVDLQHKFRGPTLPCGPPRDEGWRFRMSHIM